MHRKTPCCLLALLALSVLLIAGAAPAQQAPPKPSGLATAEVEPAVEEDFDLSTLDPVIENPIEYDFAVWTDEYEIEAEETDVEPLAAGSPSSPSPPVPMATTADDPTSPRGIFRRKQRAEPEANAAPEAVPLGVQTQLDTEHQRLPAPRPPQANAAQHGQANAAPPAAPRPRVNWKNRVRNVLPQPNGFIETNRSQYRVKKALGAGASGGAYLIEDVSNRATRGQVAVLKHAQLADPPNVNDVPNDPFHEMNAARRARGNQNMTPAEVMDAETSHEVEMQNRMARAERGFMPASKLTGNRIKMPYAGPTVGAIAEEVKAEFKAGRISATEYRAIVQQLTRQALQSTAALGRQGVVHRDLKTDNLAIGADGQMRVLDFGLAKRAGDRDWDLMVDRGVGYRSMGNPIYQAPEANETRNAENTMSTHKSDVFYAGKALRSKILDQWVNDGVENERLTEDRELNALSKRATRGKPITRLFDAMTADDPDARPTAQQALDNKRYWEKFSGRTQRSADQRIREIASRLSEQQLAAAPPAPGGPGGNP